MLNLDSWDIEVRHIDVRVHVQGKLSDGGIDCVEQCSKTSALYSN